MKKVIFVGGTSFSGSTFFHMILANDPKGFACSEVRFLFDPARYDRNKLCGCGDENCRVWEQVRSRGKEHIFESIFELFPEVDFIVDSSKSPFWIRSQSEILRKQGIQTANILIWKTPLEFAHSAKRRDRFQNWERQWINYHRLYFSMIDEWSAIKYRDLVSDRSAIEKASRRLKIPYFEGKEEYWKKQHHVLFGNYSAIFHLFSSETAEDYLSDTFDQERMNFYRSIYYREIEDDSLKRTVDQAVSSSETFSKILKVLETHDISSSAVDPDEIHAVKFSSLYLKLRNARWRLKTQIKKYRHQLLPVSNS